MMVRCAPGCVVSVDSDKTWSGATSPDRRRKFAVGGILQAERPQWFLWMPVLIATGVAVYFSLAKEPALVVAGAVLAGATVLAVVSVQSKWSAVGLGAICVAAGFALATLRTQHVAAPVIEKRANYVLISGWVETASLISGAQKIVLRVHGVDDWGADRLPYRVRLSVFGADNPIRAGDAVSMRARLLPLPGPVRPGGFDFARRNWFLRIGGTGQAFGAPEPAELGEPPLGIVLRRHIQSWRVAIMERLDKAMSGEAAGFAIAVTTGERGRLPGAVVDSLRASGLAHLLAISGLHMALVATSLFAMVRAFLALFPALALAYPIKKWAAVVALLGACIYLALSGASISTQRAFIMLAIMFGAILLDRPAISIRNVAIAALIILAMRPESALDVSFQMSFLTVTVLVSFYENQRDRWADMTGSGYASTPRQRALRRGLLYCAGVITTTMLATVATAPIAAFQFNQIAVYGVLGNLVAVPLMSLVIMPLALASLLLMPFGAEGMVTWALDGSIGWLQDWAALVSQLPGARGYVGSVSEWASLTVVAGLLWLCLWRTRWRVLGFALLICGLGLTALRDRPDVLIDRLAKVVAVRGPEGTLALTSTRAGRYVSERWLLADGDGASLRDAAARDHMKCDGAACSAVMAGGGRVAVVFDAEALWDECRIADIVVSRIPVGSGCRRPRAVIDWWDVYSSGAHAVYSVEDRLTIRRADEERGDRPWVLRRAGPVERDADRTAGVAMADDEEDGAPCDADDEPVVDDLPVRRDDTGPDRLANALERIAYRLQEMGNWLIGFLR